jgi:hypothetical protein
MSLRFEVDPPLELGEVSGNTRRVVGIKRGSFEGPSLRGEVLPAGADWQYTRSDEVVVLEARYILKTDQGDLISVLNRGFRHGSPQLASMLASGQHVPPSQYYFMTAPQFESASPNLRWLMRTIFIGQGQRERDSLTINVWQVGDDITP